MYHIASKLRANTFACISLESALSDAGVISQIPVQWLTVMTGGRTATIAYGRFGTIEFIHTARSPEQIAPHAPKSPVRSTRPERSSGSLRGG